MAIMACGRVVLTGQPPALVDGLAGKIWKRIVDATVLDVLAHTHDVVVVRRVAGRRVLRVYAPAAPGPDFEPAQPDLEDVYFHALAHAAGPESGRMIGRLVAFECKQRLKLLSTYDPLNEPIDRQSDDNVVVPELAE